MYFVTFEKKQSMRILIKMIDIFFHDIKVKNYEKKSFFEIFISQRLAYSM
jgi:hypothetical protein